MSRFKYINLDSKDAMYSTSQTYNSYKFSPNIIPTDLPNSYNAEWNLRKPIKGPKSLWLKSVELPIGFCNIRKNNGSNTITVSTSEKEGIDEYTISLSDTIYQKIETLIADINTAFVTKYPSTSIIFSLKTTGLSKGHVMVQSTTFNTGSTLLFLRKGVLANDILGFERENNYFDEDYLNSPNATRVASGKFMLNPDLYLNMYIPNLSSGDTNINGVPSSFKIPLNQINGTIMFTPSNLGFDSYVPINNIQVLNSIQIVITDRWGYSVNSRGLDYSCTFAVEIAL